MQIPEQLIADLEGYPGFRADAFIEAHRTKPPVSLRLNPHKGSALFADAAPVPWCDNGRYLEERPHFAHDPNFHAGAYYVQEASSMFLDFLVRRCFPENKPLCALDLCASPGGKSTLLASALPAQSLLVSNEAIRGRIAALQENLIKWGSDNIILTHNDPADFAQLPAFFDLLVVDAPCSGSGLFRKDPAAAASWNPGLVQLCSKRQKRILADALPALKQHGVLIYSTCSFSPEEDEGIAAWLADQGMEPLSPEPETSWNIVRSGNAYRFYPDRLRGEGLFICAFRKTAADTSHPPAAGMPAFVDQKIMDCLSTYCDIADTYAYFENAGHISALPRAHLNAFAICNARLHVIQAGIEVGMRKGHDCIPSHALAMSGMLRSDVPSIETNPEEALQFLRKNNVIWKQIPAGSGWQVVRYRGLPLGWVKLLPGRVNNYYPSAWRLRK